MDAVQRKYRTSAKGRATIKAAQLRWRTNNPKRVAYHRHHWRFKQYGLTQVKFEQMIKAQQGCCAMCKKPFMRNDPTSRSLKSPVIDHDHTTGKVRGILHGQCNRALGIVEKYGEQARAYLAR